VRCVSTVTRVKTCCDCHELLLLDVLGMMDATSDWPDRSVRKCQVLGQDMGWCLLERCSEIRAVSVRLD
jgi:hypothetical protein